MDFIRKTFHLSLDKLSGNSEKLYVQSTGNIIHLRFSQHLWRIEHSEYKSWYFLQNFPHLLGVREGFLIGGGRSQHFKSRNLQHFTVKIGPSFLLTSHFHFILKFQELDLFWILTMDHPGISIWNWNILERASTQILYIAVMTPWKPKASLMPGTQFSRYAETNDLNYS